MKRSKDIRRDNARMLAEQSGSIAAFARRIKRTPSQVNHFIGPNPSKNIGDKLAKSIEASFDLPNGGLDQPFATATYSGVREAHAEYAVILRELEGTKSMKDSHTIRLDNARMLAEQCGSMAEFARRIGRSSAQVNQIIGPNPTKKIGESLARTIEKAFLLPEHRLDNVFESVEKAARMGDRTKNVLAMPDLKRLYSSLPITDPDGYIEIPSISIRSSSEGYEEMEWHTDASKPLEVSLSWIKRKGIDPSNAAHLIVVNDEMTPRIHEGDTVLIDLNAPVIDGKIYAIRVVDSIRIARVFRQVGGGYLAKFDNEVRHEPIKVDANNQLGFGIIGRVRWIGGDV